MINMLIVDDELLMRRGLSFIPWEKAGVCLIGTASSGMEALEFIKEKKVQILFTDIQMPDINGLELIRAANLLDPSIQSVLLTGHNNFNYAKEAISLHVYDYILKPCDPDEVLSLIHIYFLLPHLHDTAQGAAPGYLRYRCKSRR